MDEDNKTMWVALVIIIIIALFLMKSCQMQPPSGGGSSSGGSAGVCPTVECTPPSGYCCAPTPSNTFNSIAQFTSSVPCNQIGYTTIYNRICDNPQPTPSTSCFAIQNPTSQRDCDAGTCATGHCTFIAAITTTTYVPARCSC